MNSTLIKLPTFSALSSALLFVSASITQAADTTPNFALSIQGKPPATVKLTTPPGHHFNLEAPKSAKIGEQVLILKQKSPTEIIYTLPSAAQGTVNTKAFVCDDANTYCVRKENQITITPSKGKHSQTELPLLQEDSVPTQQLADAAEPAETDSTDRLTHKIQNMGFISNKPKHALSLAKKQNKPLLIDFYAIWCPPCNQLDETVFPSSSYQTAAKNFVTLKLDADQPASWALKEKYNITSYPTVIFATPDGKEISRLVGALKPAQFVLAMQAAQAGQSWTPKSLPAELAFDAEKDKPEVVVSKVTTILQTNAYAASEWLEQDLWSTLGEAHLALKQSEQAKAAFAKATKIYQRILSELGSAGRYNRGYNLELAYTLSQSSQVREAELLYQRLRRRYPNEFTFHYAFSKFLRRQDRNSQALSPAKLAFQHSYGDNKLRAGLNLAQLYLELGSKAQASALASELISTANVPASPNIRTHRYIQQLRDFTQTLSAEI